MSGLNVAATYRQPNGAFNAGASATLVNSPSLTVPFTLPAVAASNADAFFSTIATGAAPGETTAMTATPQNASNPTTFGTDGGVFGAGIEPFNYTNGGLPANTAPYGVPLYDPNAGSDPNAFVPWGGPPAFDPNKDGLGVRDGNTYPAGTLGISEGLDVFAVAPSLGSYRLSVNVPANAGAVTQSAAATLASAALLPAVMPAVPTLDGNGGGSFAVTVPPGVTEAYVTITDLGPDPTATTPPTGCNGSSAGTPTYYTFVVRASGTVTLPDATGPGTPAAPTPSLCTAAQNGAAQNPAAATDGDTFAVQTVGFDYPAFEATYPSSLGQPAPAIAGANGQADVTISSQAQYNQPAAGGIVKTQSMRWAVRQAVRKR